MNPVHENPEEEFLADVPLIFDQPDEGLVVERLPVVNVPGVTMKFSYTVPKSVSVKDRKKSVTLKGKKRNKVQL